MKQVFLKSPFDLQVIESDLPVRKPGEALIQVKASGICGSDVTAYKGVNPTVTYPLVLGHETVGEVIEAGPGTQDVKNGDRVVVEPYIFCSNCYPCSLGRTNNCEKLTVRGVHVAGTMSEQITHPVRLLHKIPDEIRWEELALIEPLAIALHAVRRASVQPGEHVVISGAGPIGLLVAQAVKIAGAEPIVIDPLLERLNTAQSLGVKYTFNPVAEDVISKVREITDNRLSEVLIEASGAGSAISGAVDCVSYSGRVVLVGWPKEEILMRAALFIRKELDIRGSRNSVGEFPEAIRLIAGRQVQVAPLISSTVQISDAPRAIRDLAEHPEQFLKIVVVN
jgi:L-gulonate 5-dehydrogenase